MVSFIFIAQCYYLGYSHIAIISRLKLGKLMHAHDCMDDYIVQ